MVVGVEAPARVRGASQGVVVAAAEEGVGAVPLVAAHPQDSLHPPRVGQGVQPQVAVQQQRVEVGVGVVPVPVVAVPVGRRAGAGVEPRVRVAAAVVAAAVGRDLERALGVAAVLQLVLQLVQVQVHEGCQGPQHPCPGRSRAPRPTLPPRPHDLRLRKRDCPILAWCASVRRTCTLAGPTHTHTHTHTQRFAPFQHTHSASTPLQHT